MLIKALKKWVKLEAGGHINLYITYICYLFRCERVFAQHFFNFNQSFKGFLISHLILLRANVNDRCVYMPY